LDGRGHGGVVRLGPQLLHLGPQQEPGRATAADAQEAQDGEGDLPSVHRRPLFCGRRWSITAALKSSIFRRSWTTRQAEEAETAATMAMTMAEPQLPTTPSRTTV